MGCGPSKEDKEGAARNDAIEVSITILLHTCLAHLILNRPIFSKGTIEKGSTGSKK